GVRRAIGFADRRTRRGIVGIAREKGNRVGSSVLECRRNAGVAIARLLFVERIARWIGIRRRDWLEDDVGVVRRRDTGVAEDAQVGGEVLDARSPLSGLVVGG